MKRLLFILALVCAPAYAQTNTARMISGTNVITSCPYTIQATDTTKLLIFNSVSACTVTLPTATTLNFGAGAIFSVINQGTGTATITPTTGTIGGNASLALLTGQGADIYSDGANYQVQPGSGTSGGGGSPPSGNNGDTQCKNALLFAACAQNTSTLYVSTTGNDTNSGKTWDTAKLTIMAAVCALPGGNCGVSPKVAGAGTVIFASGVSCNSNANAGCWIAGNGDSQYPGMTSATGGPTYWTIESTSVALNFVCATMNTDGGTQNRPSCQVVGPSHTVGNGNYPLVWISGNSLGAFYMNGFSGSDGGSFTSSWGRIGIDSATGQIIGTPAITQTVSFTIENTYSDNFPGGANGAGRGPQLAIGDGFWMHLHDDGFGGNNGEACQISTISRTSNVTTVTTTSCDAGGAPTQCPFLVGDHVSIRDTTGDNSFNGTFTAATACSGTNSFTFNQTGPNFSGSVGSNGIISDDRNFGIVCYECQIEMARMHQEGSGIKFYSGPSSNLELNDVYMEGAGTETQPMLWISSVLYGGGGLVDIGGLYMSDVPTLPSIINEGGPQVFVHSQTSNGTDVRGGMIMLGGGASTIGRTTGLLASGQSGWINNQYFESSTDISRRQAPVTSNIFTNLAAQNPASWTGSSFTTASGKHDPFGGTGAIEIDATAGTQPFFYNVTQTPNVGDTWYFGGWVRAANGSGFQVASAPFVFYIGGSNICYGFASQPISVFVPFTGDGNWFWATGSCTVWANPSNAGIAFGATLNASTPLQVYRPFVFKVPSGTYTATEVADELNSLGFGPSTQAGAGDIVFPADKKLCMPSGSATNEFCAYFTHSDTANRTYTLPDQSGTVALESAVGTVTGQVLTASNGSPASFASPGLPDGNGGSAVTSTPYAIQCDSSTTLLDRAHLLRFQSGASVVTVPLSSATGCTGNFVLTLVDESAGILTVNRTSADTFSIYTGGAVTTGATTFTMTNGQSATLSQGATGIWEVRIVANPAGDVFIASTSCGSAANCVQWVDDDSTDNCNSATTAWMTAVNSYAGNGEVHVNIKGSGSGGKAYKFASCNLVFSGPSGTGGQAGSIVVNSDATIDCAQSSANCIQGGPTGGCPTTWPFYTTGCHDFRWYGGTILGCGSVTVACFEVVKGIFLTAIDDVRFINTGAGNATLGTCTNYSVQFDTFIGGIEFSRNWYYGTVLGQCFSNNADVTGGANTIQMRGNMISHGATSTPGFTACGGVAHRDSSGHSTITNNLIFGFAADMQLYMGNSTDGSWMISNNNFDTGQCVLPSGNAAEVQFGAPSNSTPVGPVVLTGNDMFTAPLFAQYPSSTATMQSWTVTNNVTSNPTLFLFGGTTGVNCVPRGTTPNPCYMAGNEGFSGVVNTTSGQQLPGFIFGNSYYWYAVAQAANVSSTNVNTTVTLPTTIGTATCQVVITQAATVSSTLPTCTLSWTDALTSHAESATVTSTSTANTVGTVTSGSTPVMIGSGTNLTVSTSSYASSGATPMQYFITVQLVKSNP